MAKKTSKHQPVPALALCLAWLVPGVGHMYMGRHARGIVIFVTIAATFWAGVAMGGVMTVDYEQERWWFVAEMFSGVHGLVGWQRQRRAMSRIRAAGYPEAAPRARGLARRALVEDALAKEKLALVAPMATVARAYAGVAGLLNLMCVFDALMLSLMGVMGEPKRKQLRAPA